MCTPDDVAEGRPRRNLDLEKTSMQETGAFHAHGLTLSELLEVANDLGIDLNTVRVSPVTVFVEAFCVKPC